MVAELWPDVEKGAQLSQMNQFHIVTWLEQRPFAVEAMSDIVFIITKENWKFPACFFFG
jgi:hypothetical protein